MSTEVYCTGAFIGHRLLDESIDPNQENFQEIKWTLSITPTQKYPSIFGAGLNEPFPTVIHGVYQATTAQVSMTELIDGLATYHYQCDITIDRRKNQVYLLGTWKSLMDETQFGKLVAASNLNLSFRILSGLWIGQADPDPQLADFLLPINPIRWSMTVFQINDRDWILCGAGYFDDAADIPDEPLLFFSLSGKGTLEKMVLTKKYLKADYLVEYTGQIVRDQNGSCRFVGQWTNSAAGSYGSFFAHQFQLDPRRSYRSDICLCEICSNVIYPGDTRWCCHPCSFSTCFGCHLNSHSQAHSHPLQPNILPLQNIAQGTTCFELVNSALQLFDASPLLTYRHRQDQQLRRITYGQMAVKCRALAKYWKGLLKQVDDQHRPVILFIADSSPAYVCALLSALLCQAVVYPISGSLQEEAVTHILSISQPSIIVVGEKYFQKFSQIFLSNTEQPITMIYSEEEQFEQRPSDIERTISFSDALVEGERSTVDLQPSAPLSPNTLSAILSTSGSTGFPKGAMFTEELLVPNDSFTLISPFIRMDYQPFDPVLLLSLLSTIKYGSSRGMTNLKDMWMDIKEIRPTSLGLTPSIWNHLYKEYLSKIPGTVSSADREQVAREMRNNLGGRLVIGTTGGGSISPTVVSFIRHQLKIDVADMYGCRECGNIARNGVIYPGVEVKMIPVADSDFDGIEEGEICVHSPKMIDSYYGLDRSSAFIDIDGKRYYRTGDIGRVQGRILQLTDRSGTMIKNSMAEWISPVKIENIIEQLTEVASCFIIGDANYAHVGVIVCPSNSAREMDSMDLLQLIRVHCVHCGLNGPEIPQCIYLEKEITWNDSNGLYKEKKCRNALAKHYAPIKSDLFNEQSIEPSPGQDHSLSQPFLHVLEKVLNRSLHGQISGKNTFLEIGGDSLSLNLLCKAFHEQGIPMNPSIVGSHSLSHLEQIFTKRLTIDDQMVDAIDWKKEFALPSQLKTLISTTRSVSSNYPHILLTGVTGFLGPLLLFEILNKTMSNVIVYCLVRAKDVEHARERLKQDLIKCQREHLIDWNRIRCINGDVGTPNLGLTTSCYTELVENLGFIYHNASWVNAALPYKALKQANVQGTLNCLELAARCHAKLIYTSSVAALPSSNHSTEDSNGWINLTVDEINKKDGYGQTKVVTEQLLYRAARLGAKILVVRPPTMSSDTISGYSNVNDFLNLLLKSQIKMNACVNNANISFRLLPVDACAKAIVQLAMNEETYGKCFDLFGKPCPISLIYQALTKRLPHLFRTKVEQKHWKEFVLKNLPENSRSFPLRDRIAAMVFVKSDLPASSEAFSPLTQSYLGKLLESDLFQMTEKQMTQSIDYLINAGFILA